MVLPTNERLVVLKFNGDIQHGCQLRLEIGSDGARPSTELLGELPPDPELERCLSQWQQIYRRLDTSSVNSRIHPQQIVYNGSVNRIENCRKSALQLQQQMTYWLESSSFLRLDRRLREALSTNESIRVLIRTQDPQLRRLPWHLWDFIERYSKSETGLSSTVSEQVEIEPQAASARPKIKVLAILGNSLNIDVQADKQFLDALPKAEVTFLVEPSRQDIDNQLWDQEWDVLFFAGHSATEGDRGFIHINPREKITLEELKYGLKRAIAKGLKIAIFNSCDGLGLARELGNLQIPQVVIMREPVPDRVAQEFLMCFLKSFAGGKSFYLAVREARERLQSLEDQFPCATWLPIIYQNPAEVPPTWQELQNGVERSDRPKYRPLLTGRQIFGKVFLTSVVITSLVVGMRQLGMLQSFELQAFDALNQLRPHEGPDPRLLVVTVTEADIQAQKQESGQGSLSERSLLRLLQKLQQYQPRTIGLDIYRPLPVEPNNQDLKTLLRQSDHLVGVCKVSDPDADELGVPPPPEIHKTRLGFSDVLADSDNNTVRRQLLHLTPPLTSRCGTKYAFSLQLALDYLNTLGIGAKVTPEGYLQFGHVILKRLESQTGGYQKFDHRGYQLLLNYRPFQSLEDIAPQVTLREILNDQISPDLVKELQERIIIIGVTAPSASDYWFTPYSTGQQEFQKQIPGVFLQAQMVSQILSAVLDQRPLLWVWAQWSEALWIWGWSIVGGTLAWRFRSRLHLGIATALAVGILSGLCFLILTQGGWVPLVPSAFVLVATGVSVAVYKYSHDDSTKLNSKLQLG